MTDHDLIEKMQILEIDHTPDGWPPVRMGEISRLAKMYTDLRVTVETFLRDLDAHEARVQPSEIRMNSAMWMQVQAFRNLLGDK